MIRIKSNGESTGTRIMTAHGVEIEGVSKITMEVASGKDPKLVMEFCNFEVEAGFKDGSVTTYYSDDPLKAQESKNECLMLRSSGDHLHQGDYLLGTKWSDGSGKDAWGIGFLSSVKNPGEVRPKGRTRFYLIDSDGGSLRSNGFRRVEKITQAEGDHLLGHKLAIENRGMNLYECLENYRKGLTYDGRSRADQS